MSTPNPSRFLLRESEFLTGTPIVDPDVKACHVGDGYVLVVKASYAEELERRLTLCASTQAVHDLQTQLDNARDLLRTQDNLIKTLERAVADSTQELTQWREGGVTEDLLRKQDGYLKVGRGCLLVRDDDYRNLRQSHAHMTATLQLMQERLQRHPDSHVAEGKSTLVSSLFALVQSALNPKTTPSGSATTETSALS